MNISVLLAMLQTAATLLAAAQAPGAVSSSMVNAVNNAQNTLQLIAQAETNVPFVVPLNDSMWPNIKDLRNAAYKDAQGVWVKLGPSVVLVEQYDSFGDLNADGRDDAAVIVEKIDAKGNVSYDLVAMLNQNNVMFDVAELPLGSTMPVITNHHVINGAIVLDAKTYKLFGTALTQVSK